MIYNMVYNIKFSLYSTVYITQPFNYLDIWWCYWYLMIFSDFVEVDSLADGFVI